MKKQACFLLAVLLLLLAVLPGAAAMPDMSIDVFSVTPGEGTSHDGYLVAVRYSAAPRALLFGYEVEQVADQLYLVESVADAQAIWSAQELYFIEPNYAIELHSTPNDVLYPRQWEMHMVNAPALWAAGVTGRGVRIAVIDSGITPGHEDLDPRRIAPGFNYLANNTNVNDTLGHGTGVTGIMVATRGNRLGMAGLLSEATIVPLKVFDSARSNLSYAIQAIYDAVDVHNVDVMNLSWGILGSGFSVALEQAVRNATNRGVIVVASVGNAGTTAYSYPAALDHVIGVGAVDHTRTVANFSQRNTSVFVTAPGVDIITLGIRGRSHYVYQPGTSFSAPFVTAMAAAARSVNPNITISQFRNVLQQTAVPRGTGGYNINYGHGIVDMSRFLAQLPGITWFTDITGHWATNSILFVARNGLFEGSGGAFSPNAPMSRAMFVTVLGRLYRQMGGTIPNRNDTFIDTVNNTWYSPFVAWAAENGIVSGVGGNRFAPDDNVSRQQAAAILARFVEHTSGRPVTANPARLNSFIDRDRVSDFAVIPMAWAVEQGIITGISTSAGQTLDPTGSSTRAQVAVILERFVNRMNIRLQEAA